MLEKKATGRRGGKNVRAVIEERREQIERWENLCRESGEEPSCVALAWLLNVPGVTAPIIGPRTVDQLTNSLKALDVDLDENTLRRIDEIWPPLDAGPAAYALG